MYLLPWLFIIGSTLAKELLVDWNVNNSIFREGIDAFIDVRVGDRIRVKCPPMHPVPGLGEKDNRFLIIYQVSELSYMNCVLESAKEMIFSCGDTDVRNGVVNILPTKASGIEFKPHHTYYWISTSRGDRSPASMDQSMGGVCLSDNMRLQIRVDEPTRAGRLFDSRDNIDSPSLGLASAGVSPDQLNKVAELAHSGKTGTYRHADDEDMEDSDELNMRFPVMTPKDDEKTIDDWQPVQLRVMEQILDGAQARVLYETDRSEEGAFLVHESVQVPQYDYQSSVGMTFSTVCLMTFAIAGLIL